MTPLGWFRGRPPHHDPNMPRCGFCGLVASVQIRIKKIEIMTCARHVDDALDLYNEVISRKDRSHEQEQPAQVVSGPGQW